MARRFALAAAVAGSLLAVAGAGGAATKQTPKDGGTLAIRVLGPQPACLNVLAESCIPLGLLPWIDEVLQKPYEVGPDYTYQERLVSRVDYVRRPPFTLTYHIRPEAHWSDGAAITAQDFIFTLRAIRRYGYPEIRDLHAPIRSARAVNSKTLRVVLRPKSARWPEFFGNILPAHALRGSDLTDVWSDRIDDPRTGRPIGSGPFLVERLERGRQLVLRRNPRYWGPHPAYVDRLVIPFLESADAVDGLQSGELDVVMGVPPAAVPAVRRQPGMRLVTGAAVNFEQLAIQLGPNAHPALGSKLVRKALAYGIDRTALVRQIWGEIDPSPRVLNSVVYLTQSPDYEPNWRAYRYRPAEARRLLEQAGCRRGADGIFSCGGKRLSLRFVTPAGFFFRAQALPLIQAQLRAAGVEVVPEFATPGAFFGQILPEGTFDVALFSPVASGPAASWAPVYGCGGVVNFTGYCQRLVTAHLNGADRILDSDRRARVLNRADRGLASDVPTIPLFQLVATAAYDTSVRSFAFLPWNPLWNAENWWLDS